jgi:hypothetical protein
LLCHLVMAGLVPDKAGHDDLVISSTIYPSR